MTQANKVKATTVARMTAKAERCILWLAPPVYCGGRWPVAVPLPATTVEWDP